MPEASSPVDERHQGPDVQAVERIGQTSKLFVRNLPFVTTDDDLLSLMKSYGEVEDVKVVRDKSTGASKGFALVHFKVAADAVAAFQALDGEAFQGRLLHIIPGKPAEQAPIPDDDSGPVPPKQAGYKAERDSKRKANAGDKTAWSTFFMREDTVAQAVADLLGITKAELLDPEAPDAAVRMALGETQARHTRTRCHACSYVLCRSIFLHLLQSVI
jgi:multiple RNA-binding domain-containing protein 1